MQVLICPLTRKPVSEEEFYALADNNYLAMIRAIRKSKAKFLSWKNKAKTSLHGRQAACPGERSLEKNVQISTIEAQTIAPTIITISVDELDMISPATSGPVSWPSRIDEVHNANALAL